MPLTDPETLFADLLPDLPPETAHMAREFKALVRAKKVKTPEQLLRVVCFSCGLAKPLREVAGTFTALYESITDQAVAERLRACGPWVQAVRRRMLPLSQGAALPVGRRFVVMDASRMQAPGAKGTAHRLPIAIALLAWQCIAGLVSDVQPGETLKHCTLGPGDVAVADRGSAQCQGMRAAGTQGADLIVRLNPFRVVLGDAAGAPLELCTAWKRQKMAPRRTLPVVLRAAGGQQEGRGGVHAYRLNAAQAGRARQKCRQGHKKGTPSAARLFGAGWVLVLTTLAPAGLSAQTIMALSRCRWHVASARKRWKSGLDVDALRAKATSPLAEGWLHGKWLDALMLERRMRRQLGDRWGWLEQERLGTWWRVWGMLKDERAPMSTGALFWKADAWAVGLKVLVERPRRRTWPQLPSEAIAVLYRCDASQHEGMPIAA